MFLERRLPLVLKYLTLAITVIWLAHVGWNNEVPADTGDGIMHFFYSQASWYNPGYFLHHWGKPFFILLSSPFAQFGFSGMIVFNLLIFLGTVWTAYLILDHFKCNHWIAGIFPLLLVFANDYTTTIVGGLTEPLFNLALILGFFFFLKERYLWFAVLISFMPFMRSEGQLVVLLAIPLLTYKRSFKILPFLSTGFFIYAIAGVIAGKSFFWFFTDSPYQPNNNIYGIGSWDHYLISYRSFLGNPGLYAMILGTISSLYLVIKKDYKALLLIELLFVYGVFIGIVVVHSYLWATGKYGSMGLTRITTQGMPLFVVMQLYLIGKLPFWGKISSLLFGIGSFALIWLMFNSKHFPVKAKPMDQTLLETARFLKAETAEKNKVYYHNPFIAFIYGENPFIEGNRLIHTHFHELSNRLGSDIQPGSLIIWDSHFGPQEAGLPLDSLRSIDDLSLVFDTIRMNNDNQPVGVFVYQYLPKEKSLR